MVTLDNTFKWVNADAVRPAGAPPVSMSGEGAPAASQDLASNVDVDGEPMLKGLIRNAKVEIVATLLETGTPWFDEVAPAPQWRFSDHAWNETKRRFDAVQSGITVTFNYETSSWGLPKRGRRFDFAANQPGAAQDLPAYLAEVITPVGYKRHVTYETTKDISVTIGGVTQTKTTWGNFVDEGWRDIDLRVEVGAPHAYGAQAKSQSGGLFNGVVYWDTGEEIRVPVIEVQSVLRANCTFDGGCVAPQAEPDTLQPLPNVPLLP